MQPVGLGSRRGTQGRGHTGVKSQAVWLCSGKGPAWGSKHWLVPLTQDEDLAALQKGGGPVAGGGHGGQGLPEVLGRLVDPCQCLRGGVGTHAPERVDRTVCKRRDRQACSPGQGAGELAELSRCPPHLCAAGSQASLGNKRQAGCSPPDQGRWLPVPGLPRARSTPGPAGPHVAPTPRTH